MNPKNMDILSIQDRAKNRRSLGFRVINGSAGMLYHDDRSLCTYESVNAFIRKDFDSYLSYPNPIGSKEYREGVLSWIFQEEREEIEQTYHIACSCSLGGTGALSMSMNLTKENDGVIILSDLNWPNYFHLCDVCGIDYVKYERFDETGHFSFSSLKQGIDQGLKDHPCATLILNDPCQNPTGYCFSYDEYEQLFRLLSSYQGKVTLLMDIAYFNYAPMGFLFRDYLLKHHADFPIEVAFSCSKCFGLYGMRLGALLLLTESEEEKTALENRMYSYARGTYSCPNNGAMGPIAKLLNDPEALHQTAIDISIENKRLTAIGKALSKVLDEKHIDHFPYGGGFFVTAKVEGATAFCLALEEKDIFLVPIADRYVRIAVSGLNMDDVALLRDNL